MKVKYIINNQVVFTGTISHTGDCYRVDWQDTVPSSEQVWFFSAARLNYYVQQGNLVIGG